MVYNYILQRYTIFLKKINANDFFLKRFFSVNYLPTGRWMLDNEYSGSMSTRAHKNNVFNNHDHCGGNLCQYPPSSNAN